MLMLLTISSLTMSLMFAMLNHPLSMGLALLIQTVLISLITGFFNHNFWFSYILFLIMIGGMLVLFIYMTSVASNEKFKFSLKLTIFFIINMIIYVLMNFTDNLLYCLNNMYLESNSNIILFNLSLNKFINSPSNVILFMLIIYLLITLVATVKITNISAGPLRQFN